MPILALQRRHREIGRIRHGDTVPTSNGKTRPRKLTHWKATSADRLAVEGFAQVYGGEVEPWSLPDGSQQWAVLSKTDRLRVLVPPAELAFSQWLELWSAAGCIKRCDGDHDVVRDCPCDCDPTARDCAITTRLSVILPDVPGLGVWRVESHGYYSATELAAAVEVSQQALSRGQLLPAWLWLDQRSRKRVKPDGKPETLKYVVVALDLDVPFAALAQQPGALPTVPELADDPEPAWQPIAELPTAPFVTVADQLGEVDRERPRAGKRAAPLPETGLKPKPTSEGRGACVVCGESLEGTVRRHGDGYAHVACAVAAGVAAGEPEPETDAEAPGETSEGAGNGMNAGVMRSRDPDARALTEPTPQGDPIPTRTTPSAQQRALMHAIAFEVLPVSRELSNDARNAAVRDLRLQICAALGFPVATTSDLTAQQMSRLIDALRDIGDGTLWLDGDVLRAETTSGRSPRISPSVVDVDTGERL